MSSLRPLVLALALACAAPLGAQDGPPPSQESPRDASFAQIDATMKELRAGGRGLAPEKRDELLAQLKSRCAAFLDAHLAEATAEQVVPACGMWFELALKDGEVDAVKSRLASVKALATKPPQLERMIPAVEQQLAAAEARARIKAGNPAPDWKGVDVHGGAEVTLTSLRGKLVLMDFWATWCPPCLSLMKEKLAPLHAKWGKDSRFHLVGLGLPWRGETLEKEQAFAEKNPTYGWQKVFNASGDAGKEYGINGIPFLCLVDEEGKILVVGSGWQVIDEIERTITERLGSPQN